MWLNAMAIWPAQHGWHPKWTLYHCGTFDPFGLFLLNIYIYYYVLLLHSYSVKNPWLASAKRRLSHPPGLRFNVLKGVPKLEIYMMATEFLNVVGGIRHIFSRNR
jgi:hypothetical protein